MEIADDMILGAFYEALETLAERVTNNPAYKYESVGGIRDMSAHVHALNAREALNRFIDDVSDFEALEYAVFRALAALQIVRTPPRNHPAYYRHQGRRSECRAAEVEALGKLLKR